MFCNIVLIYYTINLVSASFFGDLFCRLLDFGDMPAGAAEHGSGAGA
jgi:hypothetical protein